MSFFGKIGSFFSTFFKSDWTKKVRNTITLVSPLLNSIVMMTKGTDSAMKVAGIVLEVQNDLALVSKIVDGTASKADKLEAVIGLLAAISANLTTLLAAAHVKNPGEQSKLEFQVGTIVQEVQAILTVLKDNQQ